MKRTFIAVKIQPETTLLNAYNNIKTQFPNDKIKWVEPDNLHITLKFIGVTSNQQIGMISNTLNEISASFNGFEIAVKKFGIFGKTSWPRVLWLGIEDGGKMESLASNINDHLFNYQIPKEEKKFSPHLTIARIKYFKSASRLADLIRDYSETEFQKSQVREIIFYESILQPSGPIYSVIKNFSLKPNSTL